MDGADHLFAIILLVSGAVGFFRGFIRESIALASWLIGLWLAWHFAYIVNPWLGGAIVLLLVLLFGALVGSIVSHYARRAVGVAAMDRILGAAFGLARGVIVIGLLVLAGRAANLDLEPWWERTRSMPAAETVAKWLDRYARPAALDLYDQATRPAGT